MTGSWTDVFVLPDGRLGQVAVDGAAVSCQIEGIPTWTQRASEALLFCRCAVHQGLVLTIHQGHDSGRAWLVSSGLVRDLGPTFGVQPVAIDGRYAYVVRSGYTYDEIDLESGETRSFPSLVPGSSQGISDVTPDGLWWADLHRSTVISGVTLTYPNVRGPVTAGQADPPQIAAAVNGIVKPVVPGDGYEPHVAVSGTRAAVCARTPREAAYVVLDLPVFTREPGPKVNVEPEPVKEKEPPMSVPNMLSTVQAVRRLYPTPLGARHGAFLVDVAKATGGKLLRKDAGTNVLLPTGQLVSQDILVFNNGQDCFDILQDGEGAAIPAWSEKGFIAGEYIDVGSVNVPPVTPPAQPPTPPPAPPVDLSPLETRIAALEAAQAKDHAYLVDLAEVVARLDARPTFDLESALAGYEVSGATGEKGSGPLRHQHVVKLAITKK